MESTHGACVALDGAGILIRGPAGAGKSTLALLLAQAPGGAFVADDRVVLAARDGRLVARPHPGEGGRVEVRGQGLLALGDLGLPSRHEAWLRLVVDLVEMAPRLPDPPESVGILGIVLPRLILDGGVRRAGLAPLLVRSALRRGA